MTDFSAPGRREASTNLFKAAKMEIVRDKDGQIAALEQALSELQRTGSAESGTIDFSKPTYNDVKQQYENFEMYLLTDGCLHRVGSTGHAREVETDCEDRSMVKFLGLVRKKLWRTMSVQSYQEW
jgi:hypothetical protein